MGTIYSRASCTIAASASLDSRGGLLFDRFPDSFRPRLLQFAFGTEHPWLRGKAYADFTLSGTYLCDVAHMTEKFLNEMPLYKRAWVNQERQLSRRVLHFTDTQLFWECYECLACETYPSGVPVWTKYHSYGDVTALKKALNSVTGGCGDGISTKPSRRTDRVLHDNIYRAWHHFRYRYSGCHLTYSTDKLVAIQGIASWVGQATRDKLVAGLWQNRIIQDICWTADPTIPVGRRHADWIAPTWSWASCGSATMGSLLERYHGSHRSRINLAELIELNIQTNASGALERASIIIKCKLSQALIMPASQMLESQKNGSSLSLELTHQAESIFKWPVSAAFQPEHVGIYKEHPGGKIAQPQVGYVALMQQCLHEADLRPPESVPNHDTVDRVVTSSDEGDEYASVALGGIRRHDEVEALFLQSIDGVDNQYERVGLVRFSQAAARAVLQAHRSVNDKLITLI